MHRGDQNVRMRLVSNIGSTMPISRELLPRVGDVGGHGIFFLRAACRSEAGCGSDGVGFRLGGGMFRREPGTVIAFKLRIADVCRLIPLR